ncbi:hypothetical protein OB2597_15555 [Pseudooceanicola batsensis HTCC2597]|uniref:DUF1109 domain-containing protein n=1 Tax=Pseudooceanicola batsensis (strain ATCC BAA-863 / DSM 15984 / KCTC 12145 / HTCC2597) TaxID=252305 RepID=A3TYZ3_PSEBH|nr:DUF1109 domain-containing protein [Pseudooceanicola batsensis]EAQ02811.1 hypothetical protein OB2597_15555 [Pseudooceanicola batsensis HTCC2597]
MKTDDLITMLARDAAPPPAAPIAQRAGLGLGAGLAAAAVLYLLALGPRPALGQVMLDPLVFAKMSLPLVLAAFALVLGLRAVRPAGVPGRTGRLIWIVPAAAAALFAGVFVTTPADQRLADFLGHSIQVCLPSITALSMPILVGLMLALRRGAPVRPRAAGALAGLAAGGLAAALYSTFCTEDSPLFYAVWYSLGIGIAAGIGALAGGRWLRW